MMRQGSNPRRGRSRGNGKRHAPSRGQNIESNGPDVKVRGTAHQVLEKYLTLARDATSVGDRVGAEAYFQYADHYYRVLHADHGGGAQGRQGRTDRPPQPGREAGAEEGDGDKASPPAPEPAST